MKEFIQLPWVGQKYCSKNTLSRHWVFQCEGKSPHFSILCTLRPGISAHIFTKTVLQKEDKLQIEQNVVIEYRQCGHSLENAPVSYPFPVHGSQHGKCTSVFPATCIRFRVVDSLDPMCCALVCLSLQYR